MKEWRQKPSYYNVQSFLTLGVPGDADEGGFAISRTNARTRSFHTSPLHCKALQPQGPQETPPPPPLPNPKLHNSQAPRPRCSEKHDPLTELPELLSALHANQVAGHGSPQDHRCSSGPQSLPGLVQAPPPPRPNDPPQKHPTKVANIHPEPPVHAQSSLLSLMGGIFALLKPSFPVGVLGGEDLLFQVVLRLLQTRGVLGALGIPAVP